MSFVFDIRQKAFYENLKLESCWWKWSWAVAVSVTPAGKSIFSSHPSRHCVTKRFIILHGEGRQLRGPLFSRGARRDLVSLGWHWEPCVSLSSLYRESHRHLPFSQAAGFQVGVRVNSDYLLRHRPEHVVGILMFLIEFEGFLISSTLTRFLMSQFHIEPSCDEQRGKADQVDDRLSHTSAACLQLSHAKILFLFHFCARDTLR